MIGYASSTGTLKNVAELRAAGWRFLLIPRQQQIHGFRYAIDNGAWGAAQRNEPWDVDAFLQLVTRHGAGADFVVLPDIVGNGPRSLHRSRTWIPYLLGHTRRLLLPVQDGMTPQHVRYLLGDSIGLFVGGTTTWKLETLGLWGQLAHEVGCYLHVGRVNTKRRIHRCAAVGAHSFDGTSVTRYRVNLPKLDASTRQHGLRLYA
jgi:hypothetical protein